jgi:hypothetical protein
MKRRHYLQALVGTSAVGLSGCQQLQPSETKITERKNKVLNIFPQAQKSANGWLLKAKVVNVHNWDTSFHDIQLYSYTTDGTKVGETQVGDLIEPGGDKRTVEMTCSEFPAIITATARETPCEDALLPINYWVGTEAQRTETVDDEEVLWKDTYRKCREDLPPKRVLEKFDRASED